MKRLKTSIPKVAMVMIGLLFVWVLLGSGQTGLVLSPGGTETFAETTVEDLSGGDMDVVSEQEEGVVPQVVVPEVVKDIQEGIGAVTDATESLPDRGSTPWWILVSAFVINLFTNLLKTRLFNRVMKVLSPRFRVYVPLGIAGVLGIATLVYTGNVDDMVNVFMSGPVAVGLHEILSESVMGGVRSRKTV